MIDILTGKRYVTKRFGKTRIVEMVKQVWFGYLARDLTTKKIVRVFRSSIQYQVPGRCGQ
jgi:hypothetical protein